MTRPDYIAGLLLLLRLLQGTLDRDSDNRNFNYLQLMRALEAFIPIETEDVDNTVLRLEGRNHLDRIAKLHFHSEWAHQSTLCREWTNIVLILAQRED